MSDQGEPASDERVAWVDADDADELVIDPSVRFGSPVTRQATVRMALIAIGLVFFIGIAVGYFLGKGA
jgi:hypothetical protein